MRIFRTLTTLLGVLAFLSLATVGAAASAEAAPCHEMAYDGAASHGMAEIESAPEPDDQPDRPAMKAMACCVACVAAPLLQPSPKPPAASRSSAYRPATASILTGLSPDPELAPPRG